jgi:hypothetical protein
VDTVQRSKIFIITCNIPEVDGGVVMGSSVGQCVVGGQVHDGTVVSGAHVTTGGQVTSGYCVVSSVGLVGSEINVIFSVVNVHGTIFGSVTDVTPGHVKIVTVTSGHVTFGHVTSGGEVTSGHCVISSVGHVNGNTVVSVVPAGKTVFRITGLPSVFSKVYDCCRCCCLTFLYSSLQ